jgi:succinate dehydrogenase/fumarate reductase iron-sulfur protein
MQLKVYRNDGSGGGARYMTYDIEPKEGTTVLDALFMVRDRQDDSLAFRYSCRGAVCGSCAMMINGRPRLACRTQLANLLRRDPEVRLAPSTSMWARTEFDPSMQVLIEPLPNLQVIRDLVVDQGPFFERYRRLRPYLQAVHPQPESEYRMGSAAVKELEKFTNCILCAACYGACPVNAQDPDYLGPAALAKLYRFMIDPRDEAGPKRAELASGPSGWQGCKFYANCVKVCPKQVPPNYAIAKARKEIARHRSEE